MLSEKLDTEIKSIEFKNKSGCLSDSKSFTKTGGKDLQSKALDDKICKLCIEKKIDSVFFPCGHPTACFICSIKVIVSTGVCPLCRSSIQEIYRIEDESGFPELSKVIECVDFINIIHYTKLLQQFK
jgi:Zinc finger, C3HC4 type (RING finger)